MSRNAWSIGRSAAGDVCGRDDPRESVWFESVAELAQMAGVPVLSPKTPNTPAVIDYITTLQPDLILSFYSRRLLRRELLGLPRLGAIHLHGSLLPKYRGRAPVNWVLINGETQTGATLHYMTAQADAGDIIAQCVVHIAFEDTALTLFERVAQAAVELFRDTFSLIKSGLAPRAPQDPTQAPYFGGRTPDDGKIDWERPRLALYNLVRAVTAPYPGAFTYIGFDHVLWHDRLERLGEVGNCPRSRRCHCHVCQGPEGFPVSFAAPGWQANGASLAVQDRQGFLYCSDTRGACPFMLRSKVKVSWPSSHPCSGAARATRSPMSGCATWRQRCCTRGQIVFRDRPSTSG